MEKEIRQNEKGDIMVNVKLKKSEIIGIIIAIDEELHSLTYNYKNPTDYENRFDLKKEINFYKNLKSKLKQVV